MPEKPSKYHKQSPKGEWHWDPAHEELTSTSTFTTKLGRYCSYCLHPVYPIKAGLRRGGKNHFVTGTTCICHGAESERDYHHEYRILILQHQMEEKALKDRYRPALQMNDIKKRQLELDHEIKSLERHGTHQTSTYFDKKV